MTKLSTQTLSLLRHFHENGPSMTADTQAAMPSVPNVAALISRMKDGGYLQYDSGPLNRPHYAITSKGMRAIGVAVHARGTGQMDAAKNQPGQMPAPRTAPPSGEYKPKPWFIAREEAKAHELCPSIRNGQETPYTRPFSNAGRALDPAVMRGGVQ